MTNFTNFFARVLILISVFVPVLSYSQQVNNYVIMLDLSDRLLAPHQAERDKEIIKGIFDKFEAGVRKNLIINSKDIFSIHIAPQEGGIDDARYADRFLLSMEDLQIKDKRTVLERFKKNLPSLLDNLYAEALKNKRKSSDFKGADIWKFFNDVLPYSLHEQGQNTLFVISDGYFDFESNRFIGKMGNRTTDSRILNKIRKDADWQKKLLSKTEGLIPVGKNFGNLKVCVLEIHPKYPQLNEQDMLIALWRKWLGEMKIQKSLLLPQNTLSATLKASNAF